MQEGGGSGSLSITANGIYDVKRYAQAVVDVRQETLIRLPYECFILEDAIADIILFDRAAIISGFIPAITGDIPYEAFMLDEEVMLVDSSAIIRV